MSNAHKSCQIDGPGPVDYSGVHFTTRMEHGAKRTRRSVVLPMIN